MNVLVGCERSGIVRDAFRRLGHDAWSSDLEDVEPAGEWSDYHLYGDVRLWLDGSRGPCRQWDLLIAFPPCTYLCNSGVRWLDRGRNEHRMSLMREGAELFASLLECDVPRVVVENPVMHKYAVEIIGRRQDQIIQPWQFGHGEQKATGLWLKGLPLLKPTHIVSGREQRV